MKYVQNAKQNQTEAENMEHYRIHVLKRIYCIDIHEEQKNQSKNETNTLYIS